MQSRDFCYWLQGYIELASTDGTPVLSQEKMECIKKHLNMVFVHEIDPSFGKDNATLDLIHNPRYRPPPKMKC